MKVDQLHQKPSEIEFINNNSTTVEVSRMIMNLNLHYVEGRIKSREIK